MHDKKLNASPVLVHPGLQNDPLKGQGKVAMVMFVSRDAKNVYVSFPDDKEGFYKPEELLRLKDKHAILNELMQKGTSMDIGEFKTLYKISLLQDRGTGNSMVQALEIARDNPSLWPKALESFQNHRALQQSKGHSR